MHCSILTEIISDNDIKLVPKVSQTTALAPRDLATHVGISAVGRRDTRVWGWQGFPARYTDKGTRGRHDSALRHHAGGRRMRGCWVGGVGWERGKMVAFPQQRRRLYQSDVHPLALGPAVSGHNLQQVL